MKLLYLAKIFFDITLCIFHITKDGHKEHVWAQWAAWCHWNPLKCASCWIHSRHFSSCSLECSLSDTCLKPHSSSSESQCVESLRHSRSSTILRIPCDWDQRSQTCVFITKAGPVKQSPPSSWLVSVATAIDSLYWFTTYRETQEAIFFSIRVPLSFCGWALFLNISSSPCLFVWFLQLLPVLGHNRL